MLVSKLLELEDIRAWEDAFDWCKGTEKEGSSVISHRGQKEVKYNEANFELAHKAVKEIRARAAESVRTGGGERAVNLYKKCLLFDAPFEFDAAIRYAEFDRPPKRRFYEPRRKQLKQIVDAMQLLEERKIKRLLVAMPPGTGKALANDTPILTRYGWKKHGDLKVGDEVIGLNGEFKKVTHVHPKCQLDCLVEFTNGEQIICHERHEWMVHDRARYENHDYIAETKYLMSRKLDGGGDVGHRGHRYTLQLPPRPIIQGEHKDLPLDPYTFGVWLGDGANKNPRICCSPKDKCVIDRIVANGLSIRWQTVHKTTGVLYFDFNMRKELQTMGLCHSRKIRPKYIPQEYLTASVEQRLELLAGLIDTDGCLSGSKYHFTTSEESLRDSVLELLATFGWRASVSKEEPKTSTSGVVARKVHYVIGFTPNLHIPCEIERKRNAEPKPQRAIAIKSITRVEPKEGNCITVEGDGMYLAGKTMLPTHNTTLAEFFMVWSGNRHPDLSIFGASHNSEFLKGVWTEIDRMLDPDGEYLWHDIFPQNEVVSKSAKNLRIDLNNSKRFETFEFSPVGAGSAGKVRATNLIYCDDLVSGIEEAMSTQRMDQLWQKYSTDVLSRTLGDEWVELMIQTPWSVHDPIDRLELKYMNDPETKIIKIPALNAKGQSNFNYKYGLGHSTKSLNQIKSTLDDASWRAVYMMEPVERMGQLFAPDEMQYYMDLPEGDPDAVYAVCDTKEQGLDYCVLPVVYQYGSQYFVEDFICDNGKVELLEERVADCLVNHKVSIAQFESNRGGTTFARNVGEKLKSKGGHTTIKTKWNQANKETRIVARSGMIKQTLLFKDETTQNKEYELAMRLLFGYTMMGSAKHRKDDVPDALSMMIDFLQNLGLQKVRIGRRIF